MDNYIYALTSSDFWHSVWITLIYAVVSVAVEVFLGVLLALLLSKKFKGKNLVKTGFILPMVATPVAVALTWKLLFDVNYGYINYLLGKIGLSFSCPVRYTGGINRRRCVLWKSGGASPAWTPPTR